MAVRALELFCGIGGFAAAVTGRGISIVGALDQDPAAIAVYRLNFPGYAAQQKDLEKISAAELAAYDADLWWLSPPCQPYCVRGARRDLADPRAKSFVRVMEALAGLADGDLPNFLALENVNGFEHSQAQEELLTLLTSRGYLLHERRLCPTELGVPSRRPRYYLAASRIPFALPLSPASRELRPLRDYLLQFSADGDSRSLILPAAIAAKFGSGLRVLDAADPSAYTTCFTAGYGKSIMRAGSYLRCDDGVRYFAPEEIARLLHFPAAFRFPVGMPNRRKWSLLGNSLSVIAVREMLGAFQDMLQELTAPA
jgi:site-specific DNA-cytosine methylase